MRWPWVSRALLDLQVQVTEYQINEYNRLAEEYNEQEKNWSERYNDILSKYHALKISGASIPNLPQYEEPIMPPEILMRAIREVSPQQDHAYYMNYQWALALKNHWTDEGRMREAAEQIRYGSAYTPDMDN